MYHGQSSHLRSDCPVLACCLCMMPSRKRKLRTDSSNRTLTSSSLSSAQEATERLTLALNGPESSSGAATPEKNDSREVSEPEYYRVKSILEEKRGRYLIDWEDDPATGQQFKPTWVSIHGHAFKNHPSQPPGALMDVGSVCAQY